MPHRRAAVRTLLTLGALSMASACGESGPAGPTGPTGPTGPAGPGTAPSVSAISPLAVYLDRTTDVLVTGSATEWTAAAVVDFGAGISTPGLTRASPTALVATVEVDSTAPTGVRDVTVAEDGTTLTFSDGFEVQAPLAIDTITGTVAQGGVFGVSARMLDLTTPLPPNAGTEIMELPWGTVSATPLGPYTVQFGAFVDVFATPGPKALVLPESSETPLSRTETSLDIEARSLPVHSFDDVLTGDYADGTGARSVTLMPAANQVVAIESLFTGTFGGPFIWIAPPDGRYVLVGSTFQDFFAPAAEPWYFSLSGSSGSGSAYEVTTDTATVVPVSYTGPTVASIAVPGESDVYAIDVSAGQTLSASIAAPMGSTCAFGGTDASLSVVGGGAWLVSEGPRYCPALDIVAPETATYYVRVRGFESCACTFDYELTVTIS